MVLGYPGFSTRQAIAKKTKEKLGAAGGSMAQTVNVKLVHGRQVHEATVPCFLTFGQLKETASALTRIPVQHLRLNFKGREKPDGDTLASAGVKNGARIFVGEDEAHKAAVAAQLEAEDLAALQREQEQLQHTVQQSPQPHNSATWPASSGFKAPPPTPQELPMTDTERAIDQIGKVAQQVDELEGKVQNLQSTSQAKQDAARLVELLTQKLLLLDGINVTPDSRQLRKAQINRINALCDQLETLRTSTA